MSFFDELKRRNVIRVGAAYVVTAWLIIQVVETIFPVYGLPEVSIRLVITILAIGLIPALGLAWAFELTPEGLKKEADVDRSQPVSPDHGRRLDRIIIVVLVLALAFFALDKFVFAPLQVAKQVELARQKGRSEALVESYGERSIAVLPFTNLSDDAANEYLADGISEELLNLLSNSKELRVISRSSSFSFRGTELDIPTVARRLNVGHVLEGSVRKAGEKIRITTKLIEARSDTQLWSATYERTLNDVFAVQDEIATEVAKQLKINLLKVVPRVDARAYVKFLQAKHLLNQYQANQLPRAESLLHEALQLQPGYALALGELARLYSRQHMSGQLTAEKAEELIRDTMLRAIALDPNNGTIQLYYGGMLRNWNGDLAGAARHMELALELSPNDAFVVQLVASFARQIGRLEQSVALTEYLVTRDPLCVSCYRWLAVGYQALYRLDEAEGALQTVLILEPQHPNARFHLGVNYLLNGDPRSALKEFEQMNEKFEAEGKALALADLGRQSDFDLAVAELQDRWGEPDVLAEVFAWAGNADNAFEWLDAMVQEYGDAPQHIHYDPLFKKIRSDPRWNAFLERVGKSPRQLAAIQFDPVIPN